MKTLYPTLCTAALLMLAACTQDPVEDLVSSGNTQSGDLPEGTFIVDYLPSADLPATRGLGEGEAILSLDYLLYASKDNGTTYTLTKHKEISNISADTHWPLTRENMTWAQRQELKDTLSTDSKYKVVFVANAADEVWKDKTGFQPMTGIDGDANFNNARLLLPPNGDFQQTDGTYTFYYMWTGDIDPANGYNKNTPAQMNVVLQRMVNKVEIRLADEVVKGIESESGSNYADKVNNYVTNILKNYYKNHYANTDTHQGELYGIAKTYLDNLNKNLNTISLVEYDSYNSYKDKMKFKNTFLGETGLKNFINCISICTDETCTIDNPNCIQKEFLKYSSPLLYCNWKDFDYIDIAYTKEAYPQAIKFSKETVAETPNGGIITAKPNPDKECSYIFYTFSSNSTSATELNIIQSMKFINNSNSEVSFEIPHVGVSPNGQNTQGNCSFILTYNPTNDSNIHIETVNKENEDTYFKFIHDYGLQILLGWDWDNDFILEGMWQWSKQAMIDWLNEGLKNTGIPNKNDNDLTLTLSLDIPRVQIINPWSTENANQTE